MIAVVTSCLIPVQPAGAATRSFVPAGERLAQTQKTVSALSAAGFTRIILADNSPLPTPNAATGFPAVEWIWLKQYQFENKGLNELLMLLAVLDRLPEDEPIFKISARYYPDPGFQASIGPGFDFRMRVYHRLSRRETVSTRAYFVRNKHIFEDFLLRTLNETFRYPDRAIGLRGLRRAVAELFTPSLSTVTTTAIELAAARVIRRANYTVQECDPIGICGIVAGSEKLEKLCE